LTNRTSLMRSFCFTLQLYGDSHFSTHLSVTTASLCFVWFTSQMLIRFLPHPLVYCLPYFRMLASRVYSQFFTLSGSYLSSLPPALAEKRFHRTFDIFHFLPFLPRCSLFCLFLFLCLCSLPASPHFVRERGSSDPFFLRFRLMPLFFF